MAPPSCAWLRPAVLSLLIGASTSLLGCVGPRLPYKSPDHWSKDAYVLPAGTQNRPANLAQGPGSAPVEPRATRSPHRQSQRLAKNREFSPSGEKVARVATPEPTEASGLQGKECLSKLGALGVQFRTLATLQGVENPIEVQGLLGGVHFWANDRRPLQMDCRLALALQELGSVFRRFGVSRLRYSGAYVYRRTRSGRLSHHAHGLAIDIHEIDFRGSLISIEKSFARNVGCRESNPRINQLSCSMRDARLFEEFLTPDYNYDHRDHLHISVPRLGSE